MPRTEAANASISAQLLAHIAALPPAYSATGPDLPVCGAVGAPCVDALPLES